MSRLAARLVAVLAPAALLLPATAHAEKLVTEDPAGDVVVAAGDDADEKAPSDYAGVDVIRTVVAHGDTRLRLQVYFRALARDPFQFTVARIRTPRGHFDLAVKRMGGTPVASLAGRDRSECRALRATVDLGADVVTATMPTSCLDSPRWVQVGVGAVAVDEELDVASAYADDAHRVGEIRDRIAFGPKVRRG